MMYTHFHSHTQKITYEQTNHKNNKRVEHFSKFDQWTCLWTLLTKLNQFLQHIEYVNKKTTTTQRFKPEQKNCDSQKYKLPKRFTKIKWNSTFCDTNELILEKKLCTNQMSVCWIPYGKRAHFSVVEWHPQPSFLTVIYHFIRQTAPQFDCCENCFWWN